jgi:hypothetical protein
LHSSSEKEGPREKAETNSMQNHLLCQEKNFAGGGVLTSSVHISSLIHFGT